MLHVMRARCLPEPEAMEAGTASLELMDWFGAHRAQTGGEVMSAGGQSE